MTAWDVVIVGAGSAGCTLAARLSEDPKRRVLLLEAGGPSAGLRGRIPAAFPKLFRSRHDWALETEPEPGMDHRHLYWPAGKMLGGSSGMNAMLWVRGQRQDYDGWRDAGCTGWGWDEVLPAFRQIEDHIGITGDHVGRGGPMPVAPLPHVNPITVACVAAAAEAGIPTLPDLNTATPEGFGLLHVTQRNGERASTANTYLQAARQRPNLTVRSGARVHRVVLVEGRAVGVAVQANGGEETISAGEVVLSAGAVHSPQLLMLSGIGQARHLEQFGLSTRVELAGVGHNLQDHLAVGVGHECTQRVSLSGADTPWHLAEWLFTRRGPLTSTVAEAAGFIRSSAEVRTPDLELLFAPTFFLDHGFQNPPGHGFTIAVVLLRPRSTGRVSLRSGNPHAPPAIQARYLSEPDDRDRLLTGLEMCRKVAASPAFAPWRGPERIPGPAVTSREGLTAHIRATGQTLYHPVGTCAMGTGPDAVVGPDLRVHGVEGLRVVDASVMPRIISGHTNAPTIMIAERAAAMMS